ncbi:MAG: IS1634 family transposase [Nostoc sp.]|uniref:IS1634 family transposase n=1 Tax=Nostoc sp. TaxID=1180 RepID=UPI002FFB7F33
MSISDTAAIQEKIKIWKKRLAGDSNSNPLIDFRKNKKPVIDILISSSLLYKKLVGEESSPFPFNEITTKQSATERIKLLDELRKGARSSLEEKGFNSLFLVLGTLIWFDSEKPQEKYVSPILLIPVRLEKKGRKLPEFTLYPTDDDISVNFILVNKLVDEFNITLPDSDRIQKLSYENFIDAVRSAIAKQPHWQIEETAHITLFQDAKAAMIQDLEQNQDKIANHPILQGLALKRTPDNFNKLAIPQEQELDQINPSLIYQIHDADSSQQVVIEAAKIGLSCIVQGPPGTGKSQTIVNIITELIGKSKKVLVVAEKQTALEVVFDRLKKSKLEDACLNLHHQVTTKAKDFFNELDQTITKLSERNQTQQRDWDTFFKPLGDYQQVLNDHVVGLHKQEQPLNKSAFDLYGQILRLKREETPLLEFNLSNLQDWSESRLLEAKIPKELESQLKYHKISEVKIIEKEIKDKKVIYKVVGELRENQELIMENQNSCGRFILATNILDTTELPASEILRIYKQQQSSERGFRFIKDPLFFADSLFVKNPERVETMMMLMGLCLLVYNLGQRQLRSSLKTEKATVKNQLNKPTERPTLRWIFQCFQGVHILIIQGIPRILNLTEERYQILQFLPDSCQKYYSLA